jgi:tRNA G37 N-methylase Trm5
LLCIISTMSTPLSSKLFKDFSNHKERCLGKRDKSFAGRIDPKAVEICSAINSKAAFYTTSSCSGRSFLYQGRGTKAQQATNNDTTFKRCRIAHEFISDPKRYFDLSTLHIDPTGGADAIRTIGQFEHKRRELEQSQGSIEREATTFETDPTHPTDNAVSSSPAVIWLRYEPFILHVCCRSLAAASALMAAARPAFKNVGLTSWKADKAFYLVAIWGDEGLDMPLCNSKGKSVFDSQEEWLASLVNERHTRNWEKLDRFVQAVRDMGDIEDEYETESFSDDATVATLPKSFDVIGDVALLHTMPPGNDDERRRVGEAIMKKNNKIKVCAVRASSLEGKERAAEMCIIAGAHRSPLMTTHTEYGIRAVIDLNRTFFSPRMGPERLRICQQVARGENVLVLFAGVGMEALQIAGRTEASAVITVELNPVAVECARRGHQMLGSNKGVKCVGAPDRLSTIEGDVMEILPTLEKDSFDRILAPRPKEGANDGDLGTGDNGYPFLLALLPLLKNNGGECHWYDFASDVEFQACCERSRCTIERACREQELRRPKFINITRVGSVAKRQLRVCIDFKLCGRIV